MRHQRIVVQKIDKFLTANQVTANTRVFPESTHHHTTTSTPRTNTFTPHFFFHELIKLRICLAEGILPRGFDRRTRTCGWKSTHARSVPMPEISPRLLTPSMGCRLSTLWTCTWVLAAEKMGPANLSIILSHAP